MQQRTGCKILLAQKAFSNYDVYPVLAPYLAGTEASGLYESRLGGKSCRRRNHVFCAAYRADEFEELLQYADHIVFNSPSQLAKFGPAQRRRAKAWACASTRSAPRRRATQFTTPAPPAAALAPPAPSGMPPCSADPALPDLLDGLHFHTLCEQDADALALTLARWKQSSGTCCPG